jgi:predicted permease
MLLVSALRQQREIAVSGALGATPARILRQLALQGLLTALLAGVFGLILAVWSKALLVSLVPRDLPLMERISFDWRVLSFALLVTLASGIIAGLFPALFSRNTDISQTLREGGSASSVSLGALRIRSVFVVAQIAIALTLLSTTALVIRHLTNLLDKDLGFNPSNVLYIRAHIRFFMFHEASVAYESIIDGLRRMPEIESASMISFLPTDETKYRGEERFPLEIEGCPPLPPPGMTVTTAEIERSFFHTMRTPLLAGRFFREEEPDQENARSPVIINQAMARQHWPGENALGKYFNYARSGKERTRCEVIGIVADIRGSGYSKDPAPTIYHNNWYYGTGWVVARTKTKPEVLFQRVAKMIEADPKAREGILLDDIGKLEDILKESIQVPRLVSFILTFFAGSSLLLALLGTYSVIAYSAAFRTREIAIRQALGATPGAVFFLMLKEGIVLSLTGAAIGMLLSYWAVRVCQSQVHGMADISLPSVLLSSFPVCLAFVAASLKPALDAARVPESLSLREE